MQSNTATQPAARIIGRAKLRDGECGNCSHCGREIKHIVYLSTGGEVGRNCALRLMGYSAQQVDAAPRVYSSVGELTSIVAGGGGLVMVDGKVMRRSFDRGVPVLEVMS